MQIFSRAEQEVENSFSEVLIRGCVIRMILSSSHSNMETSTQWVIEPVSLQIFTKFPGGIFSY